MKREKPTLILRKTKRGIVPASAFDEELLQAIPLDSDIECKPMTRRSLPQLRLYWSVLSRVVAATEIAPSAPHLHDLLKTDLGYVTLVELFDGTLTAWPDSAALDGMSPDEFQHFMDRAFQLLAERTGIDPLALLDERRAA